MPLPRDSAMTAQLLETVNRLSASRPTATRDDLVIELLSDARWGCCAVSVQEVFAAVDSVLVAGVKPHGTSTGASGDPYLVAWNKAAAAVAQGDWDQLALHRALDDREAEYFAAQFLKFCGDWTDAIVTQRSQDDGIDVRGTRPLGFGGFADAVAQVKWYSPGSSVSLDEVKSFVTSAEGRFGVFLTTAHFSARAHDLRDRRKGQLLLLEGSDIAMHFRRSLGCS
jgi:hypothetical protein